MQCGKPLRAALAVVPATPDPDRCPLCQGKCPRVRTAFEAADDDLARALAPPRRPLRIRLLGRGEGETDNSVAVATTRRGQGRQSTAGRVILTGYTVLTWVLLGAAIVLLLLAGNQVGSYRSLPTDLQHAANLGAVIASRVAASLPYLLGALAAAAAGLGLLAIRATVAKLWQDPVLAYERAAWNWDAAYYCPTDRIVFIRRVGAVAWEPVEELQRLIAREGAADRG